VANGSRLKALGPIPVEYLRDWTDEELFEHVAACRREARRQAGYAATHGDSKRAKNALEAAFNIEVRRIRYVDELKRRGLKS
jgi:hypothetical protein